MIKKITWISNFRRESNGTIVVALKNVTSGHEKDEIPLKMTMKFTAEEIDW